MLVSEQLKNSLLVSILLLLSFTAWSISSPVGSGVDADYHLGSIWCARGESAGLCESIDMAAQPEPTAVVPFMFQMCNGRNIYFWPNCEVSDENPSTQTIRIAPEINQSVYYWTTHFFASKNVNLSVVLIRLFNSVIASLVFFALMALSSDQLRKAVVISWTLTLTPNGIQLLSGINPRSWAVLGIMSSWAFLYGFLTEEKANQRRRKLQLGCYLGAVTLTASARFDALLFVIFVSAVTLGIHFVDFEKWSIKRFSQFAGLSVLAFFAVQQIPKLKGALSFDVPEAFSAPQYFVFELVHLPEFVADWWGFSVGQQGNGPGIIGLVGVSLFAIYMFALLQRADRRQMLAVSILSAFILLALFRATTAVLAIVPLSGVYTFGLVAPLIGITATYSHADINRLTSNGIAKFTVVLVGLIHALSFYHWMEFFTRRGANTQFYDEFSLAGTWWWDSSIDPNVVFGIGSVSFSAFLWFTWKSVSARSLAESEYR
jgi:hypothetical protein